MTGNAKRSVSGSYVESSGSVTASGNSGIVYGAAGYVFGTRIKSQNGSATASDNTVTANGATVDSIAGGSANGHVDASATGNGVTITDTTVRENIFGGLSSIDPLSSGTTAATGNTVTISGSPTLSGSLYGGDFIHDFSPSTADVFTGNTLSIKSSGIIVGGDVQNSEYLNFYLPTTMATSDIMLAVTGAAYLASNAGTGTGSTVNVGIDGASSLLSVGDTVTLIKATSLSGTLANDTANGSGMQGVTLRYVFNLAATATDLTAKVISVGATEESKALSLDLGLQGHFGKREGVSGSLKVKFEL